MVKESDEPRAAAQLLTVAQVAERLNCSTRSVYRLIAAGAFTELVDIGAGAAKTRIAEPVLAEYIASRTRRIGR